MRIVLLAALVAAALLPARAADACQLLPRSRLLDQVARMDGRTGVPTNFVLMAATRFHPSELEESSLWLRKRGDDALVPLHVAFDDDFTRISARSPLEPSTPYEMLSFEQPTLPRLADGETFEDHAVHVVAFESGDGPDEEPPPRPSLLRVETQEVWPQLPFLGIDTCGAPTGGGTWARFFVEPDADAAFYVLTRGDPAVRVDTASRANDGEVFISDIARDVGGFQPYRITSFDRAGNQSEAHEEVVYLGCPGTCASGDPAPLGLVLGLLALRLRRRRR